MSTPHRELKQCFDKLSNDPECRAIVLSGAGKIFSSGLDLKDAMVIAQEIANIDDAARKGQLLENKIKTYQVFGSKCNICETLEVQ